MNIYVLYGELVVLTNVLVEYVFDINCGNLRDAEAGSMLIR